LNNAFDNFIFFQRQQFKKSIDKGRQHSLEDWILSSLISASFGVPVIFLNNWIGKKNNGDCTAPF